MKTSSLFSLIAAAVFVSPVLFAAEPLTPAEKETNAKKAAGALRKVLENLKKDPGFMKRATTPTKGSSLHNKRIAEKTEQAKKLGEKVKILFLGDSITHGWERDGKEIFQKEFAPYDTLNLGCNGDRTEYTLWFVEKSGILDHIRPRLVVVMIGTNNLSRSYSPEAVSTAIGMIRDGLRKRFPEAKIVLYGIFPREGQVEHPLRLLIARTNELIAPLADGKNVFYEDIGNYMLSPGGYLSRSMMGDLLHPRAVGYRIWADSILKYVDKYVKTEK